MKSLSSRFSYVIVVFVLLALALCVAGMAFSSAARATNEEKIENLLQAMTLEEKIGQMTMPRIGSISPAVASEKMIGSVLSGGGEGPTDNTPEDWQELILSYTAAKENRLGISLLYGIDAVHGHGNVSGATIFPHNIALGATGDADLVERIGAAVADEMAATGIFWNFGPSIDVPTNMDWGRAYEGFSDDPAVVSELGSAYIRGLQYDGEDGIRVLATAKHFLGGR